MGNLYNNPNKFNKMIKIFLKNNNITRKPIKPIIKPIINDKINKKEIDTLQKLISYINLNKSLSNTVVFDVNINKYKNIILRTSVDYAYFFGCNMDNQLKNYILNNNGVIYPSITKIIPFKIFRTNLYTPQELLDGYFKNPPVLSLDDKIYEWFFNYKKLGMNENMFSIFAMNTHDACIDDALIQMINDIGKEKMIGVMGGHSNKRNSIEYRTLVLTCRELTKAGYVCMSGGSSGMMEAVHLGALLSMYPIEAVDDAISILNKEINFNDLFKYYAPAIEVLKKYPHPKDKILSIAIPTWVYYEPTCVFASYIASYFSNPIREYNLLNYSFGGCLVSPGSAGTLAETFINHANQHYRSLGYIAPFVFLNKNWWNEKIPVFPLIYNLANEKYKSRLFIVDTPQEVVESFNVGPII